MVGANSGPDSARSGGRRESDPVRSDGGGAVAPAIFFDGPKDEVARLVGPRARCAPFDRADGLAGARRGDQPAGVVIGDADGKGAKRVGERGGDEGIGQDSGQLLAAERSRWAPVRRCARGRMPGVDLVALGLGGEPCERAGAPAALPSSESSRRMARISRHGRSRSSSHSVNERGRCFWRWQ